MGGTGTGLDAPAVPPVTGQANGIDLHCHHNFGHEDKQLL
jgi:hypothetical protein